MVYYCLLEEEKEVGGYVVSFPDVPGALTEGDTVAEALAMGADALNGCLAARIANGEDLPEASTGGGPDLYPVPVALPVLIAWELKKLRGSLSQKDAAKRLHVSPQALQQWEDPRKNNLTLQTLEKIAHSYGAKVEIRMTM